MNTSRVMKTNFSQTVMVFGCESCEGDVMPPHFFRECLRLNSDAYVELLITVAKLWKTRVVMVGHMHGNGIWNPVTPLGMEKNGCL